MGSHLPQPAQPDTSRLTSRSTKMIFVSYKTDVHPEHPRRSGDRQWTGLCWPA